MGRDRKIDDVRDRVADYRVRTERQGLQRVETTVMADDAHLVKNVAKAFRDGGPVAEELRHAIRSIVPSPRAETGEELLAFFRRSPLAEGYEETPSIERDSSGGRSADFD